MLNKSNPIGVMDSGIGGLTVVRELQRILPGEDIIYFGDSANCPYGNKTADQIFELSCHMLQFLGSNGVKCTAVACNTISTMAERLRPCFDFRIISIVEEAAKYVIREKLSSVGLIGTEFTVASGKYAELIHQGNPDCHVVLRGSSSGPNYDSESVANAMKLIREKMPAESAAAHGLIVDCSHGNSGKDEHRQAEVVRNIASRIADGEEGITGIMMESFIEGGSQKPAPLAELTYGQSITDKCLSWQTTEQLLRELAQAVSKRRWK